MLSSTVANSMISKCRRSSTRQTLTDVLLEKGKKYVAQSKTHWYKNRQRLSHRDHQLWSLWSHISAQQLVPALWGWFIGTRWILQPRTHTYTHTRCNFYLTQEIVALLLVTVNIKHKWAAQWRTRVIRNSRHSFLITNISTQGWSFNRGRFVCFGELCADLSLLNLNLVWGSWKEADQPPHLPEVLLHAVLNSLLQLLQWTIYFCP